MKIAQSIEIDSIKTTLLFEVPREAFAFLLGQNSDHLEEKSISFEALEAASQHIRISDKETDMLFQVHSRLRDSLAKMAFELLISDNDALLSGSQHEA